MAGLGTLARGLNPVANTRKSYLYLTELDETDAISQVDGRPTVRRFQYFPESISDSKAVNYQTKDVPGASLPLYQWVSGGERTIQFTAQFTTDTDHYLASNFGDIGEASLQSKSVLGRVGKHRERTDAAGVTDRNVYIPAAVAWLRRFMYPSYGDTQAVGVPLTHPPRKLLLTVPGSHLSWGGGRGGMSNNGGLVCIMTQCDVSYIQFFPSGNPRIAEVSLGFAEVAQKGGVVQFPRVRADEDADVSAYYTLGSDYSVDGGGSS